MNKSTKFALTLSLLTFSCVSLAATNDQISIKSIGMVKPGDAKTTSLADLHKDKFYTITALLKNTSNQLVDYRISTTYAMTSKGNIGDVIASVGNQNTILSKDADGYRGVLATNQETTITIKNVSANNGIIKNDDIKLTNLTSKQAGSTIEMINILATEQADSGEKSEAVKVPG